MMRPTVGLWTRLVESALVFIACAALLAPVTGCALFPSQGDEGPTRPDDLESFTEQVRDHLALHEWQSILAVSDPAHYRTQVVEGGMEEAQYVAELFGLHSVDNNIQEGDTLSWEDLERIESVTLNPTDAVGPEYELTGTATLEDGEVLQIRAQVAEVQGRFVLTGAVG